MAYQLEDKSNENQRLRCLTKFLPPTARFGARSEIIPAGDYASLIWLVVSLNQKQHFSEG
jgi:hypothetical protein